MFPKLEGEHTPQKARIIGPHSRHPYEPNSFFNISAMSYGSLSKPAIEALSHGAQMGGCWLNTGEGGLSPYHLEGECDIIFQLGTAKFGARNYDATLNVEKLKEICEHKQVKMIELKLSQGAKPGKGGILPASKVTPEIAKIRGIPEGKDAISPNRHVDASDPASLLDLIHLAREASGRPVGIKFVVEYGTDHSREPANGDGLTSGLWPSRPHNSHCSGKTHHARRNRLGLLCWRGFRLLGTRFHVRSWLHSSVKM